jgi:hypothetical protein
MTNKLDDARLLEILDRTQGELGVGDALEAMRAVRDESFDEAAKVAEAWPDYHKECSTAEGEFDPDEAVAVFATASVIARKIREMKREPFMPSKKSAAIQELMREARSERRFTQTSITRIGNDCIALDLSRADNMSVYCFLDACNAEGHPHRSGYSLVLPNI